MLVSQERSIPEGEKASLKPMHPTSVEGVDDMTRLGDLSEAALLRNLLVRHKQGNVYVSLFSLLYKMNWFVDFLSASVVIKLNIMLFLVFEFLIAIITLMVEG